MSALALRDEHSPSPGRRSSNRKPEDFAATQAAQHHRLDHRPVPPMTQRAQQCVDLDRRQDLGQRPRRSDQRHAATASVAASTNPAAPGSPSSRRTTPDSEYRPDTDDSRRLIVRADNPDSPSTRRTTVRVARRVTLRRDERQHIRRRHRQRVPGDRREEQLQVRRRRQHRVVPTPRLHELQVAVEHRIVQPHTPEPARRERFESRHQQLLLSHIARRGDELRKT